MALGSGRTPLGRGCRGLNGLSHQIVHDGIRRVGATELQGRVRIDWTTRDTAGRTHDEPSTAAAAAGVFRRLTFVGVGTRVLVVVPKLVDTQMREKNRRKMNLRVFLYNDVSRSTASSN